MTLVMQRDSRMASTLGSTDLDWSGALADECDRGAWPYLRPDEVSLAAVASRVQSLPTTLPIWP